MSTDETPDWIQIVRRLAEIEFELKVAKKKVKELLPDSLVEEIKGLKDEKKSCDSSLRELASNQERLAL